MRALLRCLTLAAAAAAIGLTGCGLFLARESPQEAAIRRDYHLDDLPPRRLVFAGEIRDFATFRLEPGAGLEFWSEDSEYLPVAEYEGQGRYSLRVDACRRDATFGDMFAEKVIIGKDINCAKWIGRFAFRARQGTRCSVIHRSDAQTGGKAPLVLWLLDCQESMSHSRVWRPVKAALPPATP